MTKEVWVEADLPDFEFKYVVSSLGRVKRCAADIRYWNRGCYRHRHLPERIITLQMNRQGYRIASLQRSTGRNDKLTLAIAPMVCRAFNGPPPTEGLHCAHLNGTKTDNRPENLAWVTAKENCSHKLQHGTAQRGERHGNAKFTEDQIRLIRSTPAVRGSGKMLAQMMGVSRTAISDVRKGRVWKHVE